LQFYIGFKERHDGELFHGQMWKKKMVTELGINLPIVITQVFRQGAFVGNFGGYLQRHYEFPRNLGNILDKICEFLYSNYCIPSKFFTG